VNKQRNSIRIKTHRLVLMLLFCLPAFYAVSQADTPQGNVRTALATDGPFWVGQAVTVHVDLLATGFTFSNQHFDLPEVPGALVLQPDSNALKLSEEKDGVTWQILRYDFNIFPQRAGTLQVPKIGVAFSVSAGYGKLEQDFQFTTEPLNVIVELPPGAKAGETLVTSTAFTVKQSWQPNPEGLMVGDALTRRITLRAEDIPGMVLPPITLPEMPGVAIYPDQPQVQDKSDRGKLEGERIESQTFVFQQPGSYEISGARIRWWNPQRKTLEDVEIEPLTVEVASNPNLPAGESPLLKTLGEKPVLVGFLLIFTAMVAVALYWFWRPLLEFWRTRQARREQSEAAHFKRLLRACRENNPVTTYNALMHWLARRSVARSATLADFLRETADSSLAKPLVDLQMSVVNKDRRDWGGGELETALREFRKQKSIKKVSGDDSLPGLNPLGKQKA
jgi:hypothetical protein